MSPTPSPSYSITTSAMYGGHSSKLYSGLMLLDFFDRAERRKQQYNLYESKGSSPNLRIV
jgi:hypothetical protein